ncbi:DNA-binding protein, partial [Bacteroides ovatus]
MEIVTMDNEVVKTMMEKIDQIADYVFKKDNV